MATSEATGSGFRARAGTLTLLFLASMESQETLLEFLQRALHGGLMGPIDSDASGEAPEQHEEELEEGPDEDTANGGPEPEYRTSPKGEQIIYVASLLKRWLHNCPNGPLESGPRSGEAITSLVCCWSATVTHALAREPLTLAEIDAVVEPIPEIETVEEFLEAMARAGQVRALDGAGETRYMLTDWMREGIAPIAAAARTEIHYPEPDIAPPDILDVEAAFQIALPLLRLPPELRGSCRLGVQIPGGRPLMAGATAQVEGGAVIGSSTLLEDDPETFATGGPKDWLDTLVNPDAGRIKIGGDARLAEALIESLHEKLFAPPQP